MKKRDKLDQFLKDTGCDAFLMESESASHADMFYATGFLAHDPFIYLFCGSDVLIVSDMELGRARKESGIRDVRTTTAYGLMDKLKKHKDREVAHCHLLDEILKKENAGRIAVPYYFPVYSADCLRGAGFEVKPAKSPFGEMRQVKTETEIGHIRKAQKAGELAMAAAVRAIEKSDVRKGILYFNDSPLTSERLASIIDHTLIDSRCEAGDIITSCGKDSADPHFKGAGELREGEPVVIDFVPRLKNERYYSDMTRTVVKGEPVPELVDMHKTVLDAQTAAINMVKAGVTGKDVHDAVCDIIEERGYETARGKNIEVTEGFIHSTGHGVGLDIHEQPGISITGGKLEAGNVVTIEPGLYYKKIGGVRIEDVVVVREKGCDNLTEFKKNLMLGR